MSGTVATTSGRRVRHEVRDGIVVMAFSLVSSVLVALLFLALTLLAGNQA